MNWHPVNSCFPFRACETGEDGGVWVELLKVFLIPYGGRSRLRRIRLIPLTRLLASSPATRPVSLYGLCSAIYKWLFYSFSKCNFNQVFAISALTWWNELYVGFICCNISNKALIKLDVKICVNVCIKELLHVIKYSVLFCSAVSVILFCVGGNFAIKCCVVKWTVSG